MIEHSPDNREVSGLWDSLDELRNDNGWRQYNQAVHEEYMRDHRGQTWFGTRSYQEAVQKIDEGWPEMTETLRRMLEGVEGGDLVTDVSRVAIRRRKRKMTDYGDSLHISRVWNGDLGHAWERHVRKDQIQQSQRHATLYVDLGVNCEVRAEEVLWRGAAALLVNDILQKSGRAVEIYVGSLGSKVLTRGPNYASWAVRVKGFREPLHEDRLAAMVSMPLFRTLGFKALRSMPYPACPTLGYPVGGRLPYLLRQRVGEGLLVSGLGNCFDREQCMTVMNDVIEQLQKNRHSGEAA